MNPNPKKKKKISYSQFQTLHGDTQRKTVATEAELMSLYALFEKKLAVAELLPDAAPEIRIQGLQDGQILLARRIGDVETRYQDLSDEMADLLDCEIVDDGEEDSDDEG